MTEKEKMLAGEVYSAIDPQLLEELKVAREKIYEYRVSMVSTILFCL